MAGENLRILRTIVKLHEKTAPAGGELGGKSRNWTRRKPNLVFDLDKQGAVNGRKRPLRAIRSCNLRELA
jgi:hypothetical protein